MTAFLVPQTEAQWQAQVVSIAESLGWEWLHIGRTGKYSAVAAKGTLGRGWPDLLLVRRGRLIIAELKVPGGMLSTDQKRVLGILDDAGVQVYVWRPSDLAAIVEVLT